MSTALSCRSTGRAAGALRLSSLRLPSDSLTNKPVIFPANKKKVKLNDHVNLFQVLIVVVTSDDEAEEEERKSKIPTRAFHCDRCEKDFNFTTAEILRHRKTCCTDAAAASSSQNPD